MGPVLVFLIAGIVEFSMVLFVSSMMEGSLREAARFGITGFAPPNMSRKEAIMDRIGRDTLGLIAVDDEHISILVYPNFESIGEPEPFEDVNGNGAYDTGEPFTDINGNCEWDADMGLAGVGGPTDVVVYRVTYEWPLMLGLLTELVGEAMTLEASIAVRNEPFPPDPNDPEVGGCGGAA